MLTHIDFESYSEARLRNPDAVGAYAYAQHPSTEVICLGYAIDGGEVHVWRPGDDWWPLFIVMDDNGQMKLDPENVYVAHNAQFERVILRHVLDVDPGPPEIWHDTAAMAAAMSMPRSLDGVCQALNLPEEFAKSKRGKLLIQQLCQPQKRKEVVTLRPFALDKNADKLQELIDYCRQDVVAERKVHEIVPPLSTIERRLWCLDQRINDRGVPIDTASVQHALRLIDELTTIYTQRLIDATNGALTSATEVANLRQWLTDHGCPAEDLTKETVSDLLREELPDNVVEVLRIRQVMGMASTAKYRKLDLITQHDGRARGLLMYHGAHTGRWAGRLFQPQNLPQGNLGHADLCINAWPTMSAEDLEWIYDNPMEALSSCLRGMIKAPPGKKLVVGDFSQIEARMLPWLCSDWAELQLFRNGEDVYVAEARKIYGDVDIDKDKRQVGKTAKLALGFGGAVGAFQKMARKFGIDMPDSEARTIVHAYREGNPRVVMFWRSCETAAMSAVRKPGKTFRAGAYVQFRMAGQTLYCRLPSGRTLKYHQPRLGENRWGGTGLFYTGPDSHGNWREQETYGGSLVENIVQASARDVMAHNMLLVDEEYPIILTVHDEIVSEVDMSADAEQFRKVMTTVPAWADGLPLAVDVFEAERYRK